MVKEYQETSFLSTDIDLGTERAGLLALAAEYIQAGRDVPPVICMYHKDERVLSLMSRGWSDAPDKHRAICEMLSLWPCIHNSDTILVLHQAESVKHKNGEVSPAVVVILVKESGAESMTFPYYLNDKGVCVYDQEAEMDETSKPYPAELGRAFAAYVFQWTGQGDAKDVIKWLSIKGFEIQFNADWSLNNIDARASLIPGIA